MDLSTESTLQSPPDRPQFEAPITTIAESVESEMGAPQVLRIPTGWTLPLRSLKTQTNYHLPMTQILLDGTAEEVNVESLAGMLDDLYNGETLPRLDELDVAFDMDEVEMVEPEEEPWDDNDSDSDADIDSGASQDERE